VRKVWNPDNFKGQVSPHELLQTVSVVSKKRFAVGRRSDPLDFVAWLFDHLHKALGGTKEPGSSIIHKCFQGEVQITTIPKFGQQETVKKVPFLYLSLQVPPAPLFKDELERNLIPQVPLFSLLSKFDSVTEEVQFNGDVKKYCITKLPPYPVLHFKRFSKNKFFTEKNPTIVNFPCKNLDVADYTTEDIAATGETKFNLLANVHHEGDADGGIFKVQVLNKANETWYEIEDLHVQETLPQLVALSPSYLQIYEHKPLDEFERAQMEMDGGNSPTPSA
jgi:U4/U6.U5 tri-snRNP-associated protein 2